MFENAKLPGKREGLRPREHKYCLHQNLHVCTPFWLALLTCGKAKA